MKVEAFTKAVLRFWAEAFGLHRLAAEQGLSRSDVLYPTTLNVMETQGQLLFELSGSTKSFQGLKVKRRKPVPLDHYLSPFTYSDHGEAVFTISAGQVGTEAERLIFTHADGLPLLRERLPQLNPFLNRGTFQLPEGSEPGPLVRFESGVDHCAIIDCTFIHTFGSAVRLRYVSLLYIVRADISERELVWALTKRFFFGYGAAGTSDVEWDAPPGTSAGLGLANLIMHPVPENEIARFLADHPEILMGAFGAVGHIMQPYLAWQSGTPAHGDVAIVPDVLLRRLDGQYDICDLKLPLLDRRRITKGPRRRRRFVDAVAEGVAQLHHYAEYFSYEANARAAEAEFGVRVSKPRLILIVGNYENACPVEVQEACRMYGNTVEIIDYDTVLRLHLLARAPAGYSAEVSARGGWIRAGSDRSPWRDLWE